VCICGSDRSYGEQAADVATALKKAGADSVLLAGKPTDTYPDVTGFLYTGCDVLEVLTGTFETLGVQ
jgi:methylmalonyl-CoA mutase